MTFEWTAHRFSGGLLALDLVNTVVCRNQPERRLDRFADPANIWSFCLAASQFRSGETGGLMISAPDDPGQLIELREAIDGWMRPNAAANGSSSMVLARLFQAAADCMRGGAGENGVLSLGEAVAVSAMKLFDEGMRERVKTCPNCDWLFVDRSKNRSRVWCDMQVCGNRVKAGKHYRKYKSNVRTGGAETV